MDDQKKILIVDDVEANRFVLRNIISEMGHLPVLAENGVQSLKIMEKIKPNLILLDVAMPEMDGYEATKLIRHLDDARADIPIVAMTANAFEEDRQKALESGMNAHVSKPVDMNMLFKVMAQILKK